MFRAALYKVYQFQRLSDVGQGWRQSSLLPAQSRVMSLILYLFLENH
ncbi:hypothetical protein EC991805_0785 [Escherichia coli 99.1805]|nr:hypothetical protein ECDEC5A_5323 [Escherichia coli DEC5A]EHV43295.1 hypothetical protein ECDEC5D_1221 [Escherichia coli DEC5D]EIP04872.1 hypothetical protein ECTW09195_0861 [Escherichia coli TW09195]EIP36608.1 hypothetical protein ECEC4013_1038 [Escherichia coli EC4013]ELV82326.1 hypothetical protein EC991805_0785 [Escherichia coli 99.1805]